MPPETAEKKYSEQDLRAPIRACLEFALKDSKLDEGEFQGLASVFNHEVDAYIPTIVEPGAFKKTLKERGDRIKVLWQHNRDEPIGFPIKLKETEEGLFIHGKISDTARGRDALALMRDGSQLGKSLELSIGFEPIRWSMEKRKGTKDEEVRRLQEVRLNEVSFVTLAADDEAKVTEVRKEVDTGELEVDLEMQEELAITDEDRKALITEIRGLNMTDLVATHRRLHQMAAKGNVLTGFSRANMNWFHSQVENELRRRAKEDGRPPPEPTPLKWTGKQSIDDSVTEVDLTKEDELHFPSRVKKIGDREKKKKKKSSADDSEAVTLGEFVSSALEDVADLPLEFAGEADDVTSPRLADFDSDELFESDDEDFAGRTLSDANRKRLQQAVTLIKELLDAAEPSGADDAKCKKRKKKKGDEQKALEHVNEQWRDAELLRARAQFNQHNGG